MESNLITERKVSGLSDAELISAYHKFRNEYKDLQIVKLINKNTNQSKVVFYSLHNGIFIDPVDGKLYKPIDFNRNAFSYTHKQIGRINETNTQIKFEPENPLRSTLSLSVVPRKRVRVPKKIHHVTFRLQEIDKVFDLIEQNREKLINAILHFNRERGKIPITKQEAEEILKQVLAYSKSRNLDPVLVLAVIWQESGFSPKVRNGPNYGLMQINRPAHLRNLIAAGIKTKQELLDIANNVSFGTAILDDCLHRYGLRDGIAAYNGGPKKRHYESTQNYAKEVMMRYHTMIDILSH